MSILQICCVIAGLAVAAPPAAAALTCRGRVATQVGTNGSDTITGTAAGDVIVARGGADTIKGGGGNDVVCAGDGADKVVGAGGKDLLFGDGGNDALSGGPGSDRLAGGTGKDDCVGGGGTNTFSTCETPRFTLSVDKVGTGPGTVTGGTAIDCGSTCSATRPVGTTLTLTATPGEGSVFLGWAECPSVSDDTCTVTLTQDTNVTAMFDLLTHTLSVNRSGTGTGTVTSSPTGIDCGADCVETYDHGTIVTLTAMPGPGSVFVGDWSGCSSQSADTCTVTMTQATDVTVTFTLQTHQLTVNRSGSGSGTVTSDPAGINCGADCLEAYDHGTMVTLSAMPAAGSVFLGWSGGGCSGTGTCTVTMTQETSVTAAFALQTYMLTVSRTGAGSGNVISSPAGISCGLDCSETYNHGTMVTLSATPASGSVFQGWSGGGCSGTGTCTVTMTQAANVTASFGLQTHTLNVNRTGAGTGTVTSSPAGINCGDDCSEVYNHGTTVTLSATPAPGSVFLGWSGGGCSGTGLCNVSMTQATNVTAVFGLQTHMLTVNRTGAGTGSVVSSPAGINCGGDCSEAYNHGTTVTLTAMAAAGSVFQGWTGCSTVSGTSCTVTMTQATSVTATFGVQP